MKNPVKVRFWGTRGSLARPGAKTLRYGGNTSCVQLTSPAGALVVIDSGTGAYDLGRDLLAGASQPLRGSLLISHTHWDHIQGFPFFAPLFAKGGHWDVYGPAGLGKSLRETMAGQMQYSYFPLTLEDLGAKIRFHDIVEGCFEIEDIHITTCFLNHPVLTLGYRFEMDGVCVVYACDHEPYFRKTGEETTEVSERDMRHSAFLAGADLVIHDAQFTDAEYEARRNWGHSPVEYVVQMAELAEVREIALAHHDPARSDDELDAIVRATRKRLEAKGSPLRVFAAADGQTMELRGSRKPAGRASLPEAVTAPALADVTIVGGIADERLASLLAEAARLDGVQYSRSRTGEGAVQMARLSPPSLVVLEERLPDLDGLSACRQLRSDARLKLVPIILIADQEREEEGRIAGVTHWLIKPFTAQYARTHMQAWIMRSACRWSRAATPPNESQRLAALRNLAILDTPTEERFDRITRLAAVLGGVPMATITLIDEHRQWFKSAVGLTSRESSRELAFCAHVVSSSQPVVVTDTLLDDRFADNPLVTGEPRIRAYCGFPVFHPDGSCLGTLCMIDLRPRHFSEATLRRFGDLAALAQRELNSGAQGPGAGKEANG